MTRPLITVYRPTRNGDRWTARADIHARGETIELQATASNRLVDKARHWYALAADWLEREIAFQGFDAQAGCRGAFCDLPSVAKKLSSLSVTPLDEDVEHAAELYARSMQGNAEAAEQISAIAQAAGYDPMAADALAHLELVKTATTARWPVDTVATHAAAGDARAQKMMAALAAVRRAPVSLSWSQDDYLQDHDKLVHNLQLAASDQVRRRLAGSATRRYGAGTTRASPSRHRRVAPPCPCCGRFGR